MTEDVRKASFERTLTGSGLVMRDQLPLEQRRNVHRLLVDWSDPMGSARWESGEGGSTEFKIQKIIKFAAKHNAGMDDSLAVVVAEKLTSELRNGSIELPRLSKVGGSERRTVYDWQLATVVLHSEPTFAQEADAIPGNPAQAPLSVWLHDQRESALAQIKNADRPNAHAVWQQAKQLVEEATPWVNPETLDEVEHFVNSCVQYSGEERKIIAKEIASTAFHELARQIGARRKQPRAERRIAIALRSIEIQEKEPAGSTAELVLAGHNDSENQSPWRSRSR